MACPKPVPALKLQAANQSPAYSHQSPEKLGAGQQARPRAMAHCFQAGKLLTAPDNTELTLLPTKKQNNG
ncbi:unnamed protein product [[Candida] boidinii]|uniref:Unnamed protein product n=1 Tax=Candida boidinii TaxID=5477 RepID=A0ACB5TFU4_CANBO|nr:unnamed protein product [[Candida] boidinii]GME93417.1 unnamed protein product [[Candida] boidinii]